MSEQTMSASVSGMDCDAPPPGTAIVRSLCHVEAVRERHLQQLAQRSLMPESRSARAWGWALGETAIAPVTDQPRGVPPSRSDIKAEIAMADERRLRGDRENRADGAATVLRWLIGEDDHLPVRGPNRGELVGGFADVVRSPAQIEATLIRLMSLRRRGLAGDPDVAMAAADSAAAEPADVDFLAGAITTLTWVTGRSGAPITETRTSELTPRDLKRERTHAADLIERLTTPQANALNQRHMYGLGVKHAVDWLLGDGSLIARST